MTEMPDGWVLALRSVPDLVWGSALILVVAGLVTVAVVSVALLFRKPR